MEDLQIVEHIARTDSKVIEQCEISGIPKEEMHKVYCDCTFVPAPLIFQTDATQLGRLVSTKDLVTRSAYSKR